MSCATNRCIRDTEKMSAMTSCIKNHCGCELKARTEDIQSRDDDFQSVNTNIGIDNTEIE